jgi:hypothetical protein
MRTAIPNVSYERIFNSYLWLNLVENEKENVFIQTELISVGRYYSGAFNRFGEFFRKENEEAGCSVWDDY